MKPYDKDDSKDQLLFSKLSDQYKKYIQYYIEVSNKSAIFTDPAKFHDGKIRDVPTKELLGNYVYFRSMGLMITSILKF